MARSIINFGDCPRLLTIGWTTFSDSSFNRSAMIINRSFPACEECEKSTNIRGMQQ